MKASGRSRAAAGVADPVEEVPCLSVSGSWEHSEPDASREQHPVWWAGNVIFRPGLEYLL